MKVLLLRDVAKIGKRFEVVNVPDGYALNKLIPKGDAEIATPNNIKKVNELKQKNLAKKEDLISALKAMSKTVASEPLEIKVQANEQGHLFQAVHESDIVSVAKARGFDLTKELIIINQPIKTIGTHEINIKVGNETIPVSIVISKK